MRGSERGNCGPQPQSHRQRPRRVGALFLPPAASGTNVLLHGGLPDTWAGREGLHQAQGTFLRDAVATQAGREMRFGLGCGGSTSMSPSQPPLPPLQLSFPGGETFKSKCPFPRWRHWGPLWPHLRTGSVAPVSSRAAPSGHAGLWVWDRPGWQLRPHTEHPALLPSNGLYPGPGCPPPSSLGRSGESVDDFLGSSLLWGHL